MSCPSCGVAIADPEANFCPRCGTALGAPEAAATEDLSPAPPEDLAPAPPDAPDASVSREPGPAASATEASAARPAEIPSHGSGASPTAGATDKLPPSPPPNRVGSTAHGAAPGASPPAPSEAAVLVRDLSEGVRRSFVTGGWQDATAAAGLAFLVLLGVGAVLLLAAKLDAPALGSAAGPLGVLGYIVIFGLGCLRVPIDVGGVQLSTLPLGAFAVIAWGIAWAAAMAVRKRDAASERRRAAEGAKVGVPFGVLCFLAALIFRVRSDVNPIAAEAGGALILGVFWGALFGAIGGLRSAGLGVAALSGRLLAALGVRKPAWRDGLQAGAVVALAAGVLGAAGLLIMVIFGLATSPNEQLAAGTAIAAVIYFLAFAPNLVVAVIALGLGASIDIGARAGLVGTGQPGVDQISLWSWSGGGEAPWYVFLLLLVPLCACLLGGFFARRASQGGSSMLEVVAVAAVSFALLLVVASWLGGVRFGAQPLYPGAVLRIAPDAAGVFLLALLWAGAGCFIGWKIADTQASDDPTPAPSPTPPR